MSFCKYMFCLQGYFIFFLLNTFNNTLKIYAEPHMINHFPHRIKHLQGVEQKKKYIKMTFLSGGPGMKLCP